METLKIPIQIKNVIKDTVEGIERQIVELTEFEAMAIAFKYDLSPTENSSSIYGFDPIDFLTVHLDYNWDPTVPPERGYYQGPRCLDCQPNWLPLPKAGAEIEACNIYCNPTAEYSWWDAPDHVYLHSGVEGFGCWEEVMNLMKNLKINCQNVDVCWEGPRIILCTMRK